MECSILIRASSKRHKGGMIGIFILVLIVCLALATVLCVWNNSARYVEEEMQRLGFGEITTWVSDVPDLERMEREIAALAEVEGVGTQRLVYSEYQIGELKSDSEGQLIVYDPERYPYKIFSDDRSAHVEGMADIAAGEIYVSPSLTSMFGVQIGDEIRFPIARQGVEKAFVIKGFFEDPFMGSTMIGMKSFLICEQDGEEIAQMTEQAGIDALARQGAMLHVFSDGTYPAAELNQSLNEQTDLAEYVEFTHSRAAISGFMMTLQNAFTGLMLAFVVILAIVALIVLGHSITSSMEQDVVDIGILKAMGFQSAGLRKILLVQYLIPVLCGMLLGAVLSLFLADFVCRMTVTTTGLLIPSNPPANLCIAVFAFILALLAFVICLKTKCISKITPMRAIRNEQGGVRFNPRNVPPVHTKGLYFWLAMRQLFTGRKRYVGALLIAVILVFFTSLIGRMDSWLGPNGQGMMDAFNPADLHIAVQPMQGNTTSEDVEDLIASRAAITDQYLLAMPGIAVNGVDYAANVITQPERFHMLSGRSSMGSNEVVLTEFAAADLQAGIGDTVTLSADLGSAEYTVSGIYQCANDMGANIGMSAEGYGRIAKEDSTIWCTHYFLADVSQQPLILQELADTFGGDVYVHENTWPGLNGILAAMRALMILMYGVVAIFVLVVTILAGSKLLSAEQCDLGIYKALGCPSSRLRFSFAMRFCITAVIGSAGGILLAATLSDPLVSTLLRMFGISNFASQPDIAAILLPAAAVSGLFAVFAYIAASKIKRVDLTALIRE